MRDWKEKQNKVRSGQMTEEEAKGAEEEDLFPTERVSQNYNRHKLFVHHGLIQLESMK